MCVLCCAVLTKDEAFIEREIILNCLENAVVCIPDMQRCIIEADRKWLVERFISNCGVVATCPLWTRIKTLIDELRELLFFCNDLAGKPTLPKSTSSALALGNPGLLMTAAAHAQNCASRQVIHGSVGRIMHYTWSVVWAVV